ncbi:MAG: response regulator [Gemmatimonadaceae bacterium]|nr:response regulator [Gemmatimonadaceae bacterium]NUO94763.1 response regulator [Gemmatimonadaceae bacterium]NUP54738.1 response regulator [Gemmatimonadaceae bacterium]NUP69829.1 response regulator [Gemmatimonadaceae bacterium]NUR34618.1 response regulator [Gemmatimonadaceae bacterium]
MKILVADDDRVLSQLLCDVVRKGGHLPIPAFDAMQTLMFAMRAPAPALIILDINMPGGTGLEALRKLKLSARTAPIPVIVLSGSDDAAVPDQVRALGAAEFLPKPIDPDVLLGVIERVREAETAR